MHKHLQEISAIVCIFFIDKFEKRSMLRNVAIGKRLLIV